MRRAVVLPQVPVTGYEWVVHRPNQLTQAQRDLFGAHTFERLDREPGKFFHHHWGQK